MNQEQKLENFAARASQDVLKNALIEHSTGYLAFGRYNVEIRPAGVDVYLYDDLVGTFSNKKTAISWCIAERYKQYQLSFEIQTLDTKKSQLSADITTRRQLTKGKDTKFTELVETKLEPKIRYYNSVKAELEKCVDSAKYLQLRGFSNETARTSRG